jgi:hypothetical protein
MYYVYFYKDPITLEIFYIGKGKGNRLYSHWKRRNSHYNLMLREKLQAISQLKMEPIIEKYKEDLENYEAFYLEFELIQKYGRLDLDHNGILCNRSFGFEHFNISKVSLPIIRDLLKDKKHFNSKYISEEEKNEICNNYLSGLSMLKLAKMYSHGPNTIKEILLQFNIKIKNRGGQIGENNGMYGIKRENTSYFKGKSHTVNTKNKISLSLKGKSSKKIIVNSIEFNSIYEAANQLKIPRQTLARYAKNNKSLIRDGKIYIIEFKGNHGKTRSI